MNFGAVSDRDIGLRPGRRTSALRLRRNIRRQALAEVSSRRRIPSRPWTQVAGESTRRETKTVQDLRQRRAYPGLSEQLEQPYQILQPGVLLDRTFPERVFNGIAAFANGQFCLEGIGGAFGHRVFNRNAEFMDGIDQGLLLRTAQLSAAGRLTGVGAAADGVLTKTVN